MRHQPGNEKQAYLSRPPFVGRERDTARLQERLKEAASGQGGVVMLAGEPGIGKTRTAEVFMEYARSEGATVLWGRSYDGEWAPPYGPFAEAIAEHVRGADPKTLRQDLGYGGPPIGRLAPALRERLPDLEEPVALQPDEERFRLLDAVSQFLIATAQRAPVVLVLDDLHWADRGAIAMFRHVARFAKQNRILLVGTYRDVEVDRQHPLAAALGTLRRQTDYERILLTGLAASEVSELLTKVAGQEAPAALVEAISAETGGNPFFVHEVLRHLAEMGLLYGADGRLTSDVMNRADAGIAEGVRQVIGQRISRLSESTNALLSAGSAFEGAFRLDVVASVAGVDEQEALAAVDQAVEAQVLRPGAGADTCDFTHALFRHTLYAELTPPRQVRLHRRIAEALAGTHDSDDYAAEIAYHYHLSATLPGAEQGVPYAIAAADRAEAAYAREDVASFLRMALDLMNQADAGRVPLLERLTLALVWALEFEEAASMACQTATLFASSEGDGAAADFLAQTAQLIAWAGSHATAWTLAGLGLHYTGERRDTTWAILTRYDIARREAEDPDNPGIPIDSPERREIAEIFLGEPAERRPEIAFESREQVLSYALDQPGTLVAFAGEYRLAAQMYQARAQELAREGRIGELVFTFAGLSRSCTALGQLQRAHDACEQATQFAARLPEGATQALQPLAAQWELRLAQDPEDPAAISQLRRLLQHPSTEHHFALAALRASAAVACAFAGERDEALGWLEMVIDPIERAPAWATNYTAMICLAGWSLWLMAETIHSDVIERNLIAKTLAADFRYPMHDARLALARLCALQARHDEAVEWFQKARAMLDEQGARPLRAIVDYDEALMYVRRGRKGDRGRATPLLEAALAQFREIGMTGWIQRAEELRRGIVEKTAGLSIHPDGLTPREVDVLRLIAAGRTNTEIASDLTLSVRTVARHITNIYAKIGARNKAEATDYVHRNKLT